MLGIKLTKNVLIEEKLIAHANYIFECPVGSFFPAESPLNRFIEEGAMPMSNRQQMRKDVYLKEITNKHGVKTLQEVVYWRNVWAANVKQARHSRSQPLITSLGARHIPVEIQAMNQVAFDSPPEIYIPWFYKYFMTAFNGKEVTDKVRCALLQIDKDQFRQRIAFLHLWVNHNYPKQLYKFRKESAELSRKNKKPKEINIPAARVIRDETNKVPITPNHEAREGETLCLTK